MNETRPLTDEQVREFQHNGFLHGGLVLSGDETAVLREALQRVMDGKSEAKPDALRNISAGKSDNNVVIQIVNIWEAEPAFKQHLFHPKIVQMAAQLMQTDTVRVWHDQVQVKPPHIGGPTTWHQDFPYWPVIQPADLVSAWVALEDADQENGCMGMVPGSHLWGAYRDGTIGTDMETYLPAPDDADFLQKHGDWRVVPCPVRAGHVLFHHCMTWHGAPANRSPRSRPAIAVHYMPGWTLYTPDSGKNHLVEQHIDVAAGEILKGAHFPTVLGEAIEPAEPKRPAEAWPGANQ